MTNPKPGTSDLFLLDTHVLLWAVAEPHRLARGVRALIDRNQYAVSVASFWELIDKKDKRDAPVKDPTAWWNQYVTRPQTQVLAIRSSHVAYLEKLPCYHRDPYGRILMAQSAMERMPLVTADGDIQKYGIELRNATA